jgi:hypothetical protein
MQCPCKRIEDAPVGNRVFLSTRVTHTLRVLRSTLGELGMQLSERGPGLLEMTTGDSATLLRTVRERLTTVEAEEVHVAASG